MNSETQITEIPKYKLQDNRKINKIRNTKIQIKGIYKYKLQIYQNTSYKNI